MLPYVLHPLLTFLHQTEGYIVKLILFEQNILLEVFVMERLIQMSRKGGGGRQERSNRVLVAMLFALLLLVPGGTSLFAKEGIPVESLDLGASAGIPLGAYREISQFIGGTEVRLLIGLPNQVPFYALVDVQVLGNVPVVTGTTVLDFSASIGGGMKVPLAEGLNLGFFAAYGIMPHLAVGDWGNGVSGTHVFIDQVFSLGGELEIIVSRSSAIYIRPQYTFFLESDNAGHVIGLQTGYRFLFGEEN